MKKIISIICIFTLFATNIVHAYSDIYDTNTEKAVAELSKYEIINGYDDNTFKPDMNITRAEFCKMIISCGMYAYYSSDTTDGFSDISDAHWAKNYIHIAKSLNIVNGVTDTQFKPEDNITYEQAIKMIICSLGFDDKAERKGGYPNGYISVAEELGITNNVLYNQKEYATRGNIALMIYNALDVSYYTMWVNDGDVQKKLSDLTLREQHEIAYKMKVSGDTIPVYDNDTEDKVDAVG